MIVGIEGLSKSGKTTLINKLVKRNPEWIRFRGAGAVNVGMGTNWHEYNFWMHNIIENLDRLNDYEKIILWDRFITDCVYSEDENYQSELFRVIKSHKSKCIIFVDIPQDTLIERGTKEGDEGELKTHQERYYARIKSFNNLKLKGDASKEYFITDEMVDQVEEFVKEAFDSFHKKDKEMK